MLRRGFKSEVRSFCIWLIIFLAAGSMVGLTIEAFCLFLTFHTFWYFSRLYKLENWVHQARKWQPPAEELSGAWADITDDVLLMYNRHEKEKQRLETVVQRVQDMTTALKDGVILVDQRGNLEWWNRAAGELFNFRDIDLGQKITNLVRFPRFARYYEAGEFDEPLAHTLVNKANTNIEFIVHSFGRGERLIIVRDISRMSKLEEMRKDFVANVSHELRTPLTVLRGYLETMEYADNVPPVWQKALANMLGQTSRMTTLINDLITLTKLETGEKDSAQQIVNIQQLSQRIAQDAQQISGDAQHKISVAGEGDICIFGQESELQSAISNLVLNAINYTPPGGEILISYRQSSKGTDVTVSDNGEGIDPKHIPRLTERFYRVDPGRSVASGGTGLGLAIVKHVLLRHGAELRISSVPGRGSQFTCYFPPSRAAPKSLSASA